MELTDKQIKEVVLYGTLDGKQVCDLVKQEGFNPHLDWAIDLAFDLLCTNTMINGVKAKEFLWKRLRLLVDMSNLKVNKDGKEDK